MSQHKLYNEKFYFEFIRKEISQELLIFVHPLGMSHKVWDSAIAYFKEKYDLLLIDLPGHGNSKEVSTGNNWTISQLASDIKALANSYGYQKAHYIGTSIGGAIGQEILLSTPDFLQSLVVTNTHHKIGTYEFWNARATDIRNKGLEEMAAGIVPRWFAPQYINTHPEVVSTWQRLLEKSDNEGYALLCEALGDWQATDRLAERDRSIPVLCIAGKDDPAMPLENMQELAKCMGSEPLAVMEIGHVPSVEAPEAFNQLLNDWLTRI